MAVARESIDFYYEGSELSGGDQARLNIVVNAVSGGMAGDRILHAGMILPKKATGGAGTNLVYYCHGEASSDISGYKKLTTSAACQGSLSAGACSLYVGDSLPREVSFIPSLSFATEPGEPGISGTLSGTWIAYIRRNRSVDDATVASSILFRIYKRNAAGTETQLAAVSVGEVSPVATNSTTWISSGALAATDRIVIKVSGYFARAAE